MGGAAEPFTLLMERLIIESDWYAWAIRSRLEPVKKVARMHQAPGRGLRQPAALHDGDLLSLRRARFVPR